MALPTRIITLERPSTPLGLVSARLRAWGCVLHECASADEALARLQAEGADVILIDAWVEQAMTLLSHLKASPESRYLPVVIATGEEPAIVAAHGLALGADDVFLLPIDDGELHARIRALSRLAVMEVERRRRETVLEEFGVVPPAEALGVPAIDRIGILLIGPAGGDQIQVMTALGGAATVGYAETVEGALERLHRDDLDVALITASHDHDQLQRLCAAIRTDPELFDLPVLLVGRPDAFSDRALPFEWGVSDVLFRPFRPEVLRLRVQGWVRQQRLRRRLRGCLDGTDLPATTDRLTRLYGHGFLHGYLNRLIAQNRASGTPVALVTFDVAQMAVINRTHGYSAGDRTLAQVGTMIARTSRAEDLAARIGADRFCLVINGATAAEARVAGDRIAAIVTETPIALGAVALAPVALQTGIAELSDADDDAASLVARAVDRMQPYGLRAAS